MPNDGALCALKRPAFDFAFGLQPIVQLMSQFLATFGKNLDMHDV